MAAQDRADIMAFVKYEHQVFVASLNPYDGYEQWIKVLSGLAPLPVDVVLMQDKAITDRTQGIAIVDRQSFMEAMKVVDKARKQNEVLRIVLYPIETSKHPDTINLAPESPQKKHIPLQRLFPSKVATTSEIAEALEAKLEIAESVSRKETPQWATEMKKDLDSLIEDRFQELHKTLDEKLTQLGFQMKESMMMSQHSTMANAPRLSQDFYPISSASTATSSVVVISPQQNAEANLAFCEQPQALHQFVASLSRPSTVSSSHSSPASSVEVVSPQESSSLVGEWVVSSESRRPDQGNASGYDHLSDYVSGKLNGAAHSVAGYDDISDAESVVLVSHPDSSNIDVEILEMEADNQTVGKQSDSVEIVDREQVNQHSDDLISDSGSVVYVDTEAGSDEDDEEESFSNLRSWAADGAALTSSQTTYLKMADSYREPLSMQSSFHSTISARQDSPQAEETIVYKSWPAGESILSAEAPTDGAAVESTGNSIEIVAAAERPVPVNGSAQLPINLNAMKSVEEQNLFSPNSDIGTMLLSAASSIANGFLQSMESLSKTLNEYEQRRMSRQSSNAASEAPSEAGCPDVQMDSGNAGNIEVSNLEVSVESEAAPPIPPRNSRGPRGPPPSTGPYMSWEQITWYCTEYGVPDLIKAPWVNDRLTMEDFNVRIVQHFDQLE